MVKICCAPNCRNKSKTPGISLFCFPKTAALRQQWIRRVRKTNFHPTRHTVLCSDHFSGDCFLKESVPEFLQLIGLEQRPSRRRLKNGAVPSLFRLTSNGWAEGHGEEEDEFACTDDESEEEEEECEESEDVKEESDEPFIIQLDLAEEDTEMESSTEDQQNPSSQPKQNPSHAPSPTPHSDYPYINMLSADHMDEQGDSKEKDSTITNNTSICPCIENQSTFGDGWKNAAGDLQHDSVDNKHHQKDQNVPDFAAGDCVGKEEGDMKEGRPSDEAEAGEEAKGDNEEEDAEKEPLFIIESVCTLKKDSDDLIGSPANMNGDREQQLPSSHSSHSGSSCSTTDKRRKLPRKSPPSRRTFPKSLVPILPAVAVPGSQSPGNQVLCRIDPKFCKLQPVFQMPFVSSTLLFNRTTDSEVVNSTAKLSSVATGSINSDVYYSGIRSEEVMDQGPQLSVFKSEPESVTTPSSKCPLPCCSGKSSSASSKLLSTKQERADNAYPGVAKKTKGSPLPDPKRTPSTHGPSPEKIPFRCIPVRIIASSTKKDSSNKSRSMDPSISHRSEPITVICRSGMGPARYPCPVPYRSEPLRKLPFSLILPKEPTAPEIRPAIQANGPQQQPVLSTAVAVMGSLKKATERRDLRNEVDCVTGRCKPRTSASSAGLVVRASKRKKSKVIHSSSNRVAIPLTMTGSGLMADPKNLSNTIIAPASQQQLPQWQPSGSETAAAAGVKAETGIGTVALKMSEGPLYIRREHVMADLLDVFKHSAHLMHRATVFCLCHKLTALAPTSVRTPDSDPGIGSSSSAFPITRGVCMSENCETVEHKRLFSMFWEECMALHFHGNLEKVPKANDQLSCNEVPYLLGKVLRHGLVLCGYWPVTLSVACAVNVFTGEKCSQKLFRSSLLKTMFEYEVQALQDLENSAREGGERFQAVRHERRVGVVIQGYGGAQCQVPTMPEEVDAFLNELAAYYLYCQPFWWLREMRRGFLSLTEHSRLDQNYLSDMTEGEVVDMYRTLTPTPETLLPRLSYLHDEVAKVAHLSPSLHRQRMQMFLERCLLRLTPKQLVQLLKLWSDADCLLDDSYHVHFTCTSSTASTGTLTRGLSYFRPSSNTLVLMCPGSTSFEHFETLFLQLIS